MLEMLLSSLNNSRRCRRPKKFSAEFREVVGGLLNPDLGFRKVNSVDRMLSLLVVYLLNEGGRCVPP
jgi:hypothetical protein